ncbi:MAG: hypothetical protein D6805_04700 [Planctomycetota bacterium]|nr:MAG: hypothetical protein D6805_04700 [Planctomycetota bacterium]
MKILPLPLLLLLLLPLSPPLFGQEKNQNDTKQKIIEKRKHFLKELEAKIQQKKIRQYWMKKELRSRRKKVKNAKVVITEKDLISIKDASNNIIGYKYPLHNFFEKYIERTYKRVFYYPLLLYSIYLNYEGNANAILRFNQIHEKFYSYYKSGNYLFFNKKYWYDQKHYLFFATNDPMTLTIKITYLGIDSIQTTVVKHWENDLRRIPPLRHKFYSKVPTIRNQNFQVIDKSQSLFSRLVNLLKFIKDKYDNSGPMVRKLIEDNYLKWIREIHVLLEKRNEKIDNIFQKIDELSREYKDKKRASYNLNENINEEYKIEIQLRQALDTSDILQYFKKIQHSILEMQRKEELNPLEEE